MSERLKNELEAFKNLWKDGYYEGDPLDPLSGSSNGKIGYMSVLYAAYIICIRPYVNKETIAVEIGPGRGCWTRAILNSGAKAVWCLDALSADHNGFWKYLGSPENVKYFQVKDFDCKDLPDDHFTYLFSYGCFNHISPLGLNEYVKNLYRKLKPGAHAFIMFSDYDKYNNCMADYDRLNIDNRVGLNLLSKLRRKNESVFLDKCEGIDIKSGRFYHNSINDVAGILEKYGYHVLDRDCMANHRDPIIHFMKPSR